MTIVVEGTNVVLEIAQVGPQGPGTTDYTKLTNIPQLGTGAFLNVATSGNASSTQLVKGDDTRLTDARVASDVSLWAKASTKPVYAYNELTSLPTLGTVASLNVPTSGDANTAQVVLGTDSRLADSRVPKAHTHAENDIVNLASDLAGKASTVHKHVKADITDFPTSLAASDVFAWAKAENKPVYTYSEVGASAASHTHAEGDVVNLTTDLATKVVGPASSTIGHLATFSDTTGKLVQDNGAVVSVPSTNIYIDGNRTDSYTPNGTLEKPYLTLHDAVTAISALTNAIAIHLAPGTYVETTDVTLPNAPLVIYGNGATISASGHTITFQNPNSARYNLFTVANVVYNNFVAGARNMILGGSITGNVTANAYCEFIQCQLNGGLVTVGTTGQVVLSVCTPTSRFTSAGILMFNGININTGYAGYLVTSTAGLFTCTNSIIYNTSTNALAGGISCDNAAAATTPNMIVNSSVITSGGGISAFAVNAGTAYTMYSKNNVGAMNGAAYALYGTHLIPVSSDIVSGATVMGLGSDATGDIYYRASTGALTRLGIGTSTQFLHGGTTPVWGAIAESNVTNLTTDLTAKIAGPASSTAGHLLTFADASGKLAQDGGALPTTLPASDVYPWAKAATQPAPIAHSHAEADVVNLTSDLSSKVGTNDSRLSDARTPLAHTHPESDVTGLTTDLAARVVGPAVTVTPGHVAVFSDAAGKVIRDGGYPVAMVNDIGIPGQLGFGVGVCPGPLPAGMVALMGTFDPASDNYGNYQYSDGSIMVWIPAFFYKFGTGSNGNAINVVTVKPLSAYADVASANTDGYALHRMFYDGGFIQPGVFVDKYICSNNGGIASSIQNGIVLTSGQRGSLSTAVYSALTGAPANNYGSSQTASKTRGANFFANSRFIQVGLALLALAHGQAATSTLNCAWYMTNANFPKGCNNGALGDAQDSSILYVSDANGTYNCGKTGSANYLAKTAHNGQNSGVCDLNGLICEVGFGLTSNGTDLFILKTAKAMKALTGGDTLATDLFGAQGLTANYDDIGATYGELLGSSTVKYYGSATQVLSAALSGNDWAAAGLGLPLLGGTTGTNMFGNDCIYDYKPNEMCPISCADWNYGSSAGVWALDLSSARASSYYSVGFRSALYLL